MPISNDLMRFADPAIDAFVRDDLVKVMALREDLAFLTGDGTQDTPRGFFVRQRQRGRHRRHGRQLAPRPATRRLRSAATSSPSNETYTLATVATEIGGAANKLDVANVPDDKRVWFMHPRAAELSLRRAEQPRAIRLSASELDAGTLRKLQGLHDDADPDEPLRRDRAPRPIARSSCWSEMTEAMLFDAMTLELAVSREGSYYDANAVQQNAFQNDETLIRAIAEHDFLMRHDAAVAVIQNVRWANSGSL